MTAQETNAHVSPGSLSDGQANTGKVDASKRKGRPPKSPEEKYRPTYIFFHPKIIEWARGEAERRGIGYQSVINEALLDMIAP